MSEKHTDYEARVTELESRLAFQELTIEELHQVLYRQQKEIDGLVHELKSLQMRLREFLAGPEEDSHG